MILYFSGTGNSRFAAEKIAAITNDEVISMTALIKKGENPDFYSEKPYVFVTPTYAWRIPRLVEERLKRCSFSGDRRAYFMLTCGADAGNASKYAKKLCKQLGLGFMGLCEIMMPENYSALFKVPDPKQAAVILDNAQDYIGSAAKTVADGGVFCDKKPSVADKFNSSVVNAVFYKFFVNAKAFKVNEACYGCGLCSDLCPTNNIKLADSKPSWGNACTHCMACLAHCPADAISYKNSRANGRYCLKDNPS